MALYIRKQKADILREALRKLEYDTPIKTTGPGSIARAFTEAISTELGDMYDALDYNLAQSVLSTANGTALDKLGSLYDVKRKTLGDLAATDQAVGRFYFYLSMPHDSPIIIPRGTKIYTDATSLVGRQMVFETVDPVTIPAGRTRVFASIKPSSANSVFTAGVGTLIVHDFPSPPGVIIKCTNPKPIAPQLGMEDDDNYRIRIMKSIRVASSGTVEALRFAALGVNGVRDIRVVNAYAGLGSAEVVITPEDKGVNVTILSEVVARINKVRPIGIRVNVREASKLAIDVEFTVHIKNQGSTSANERLARSCKVAALRYLNSLTTGETLVYTKMINSIIQVSDDVRDIQITGYAPNGVQALRRNYEPEQDQLIVPGYIRVSYSTQGE